MGRTTTSLIQSVKAKGGLKPHREHRSKKGRTKYKIDYEYKHKLERLEDELYEDEKHI